MEAQLMDESNNRRYITNMFLELRNILGLNQVSFARLFGMSKQSLSKLELSMGKAKMTFPSILMISYTLSYIIQHNCFNNFNIEQKQAIINLDETILKYVEETKPDQEVTDAILNRI